jgi:3-phenylpropionate/trans-cinnamate dioxygenase ferredoxin reductase subunit
VNGTVLVVGAGLAGSRCAESLRAFGWQGRVLLAGDEPEPPYERPAVSKRALTSVEDVSLRPLEFWDQHAIELRLGATVTDIDNRLRTARVGVDVVEWDALVWATGVRPRRLDGPPGVHHLRSLADARRLRADLRGDARVVIVGAGFIGGEVASSISGMVGSVTVIEPAATPLERVLGTEVGSLLASRYRAHGVDLRLGTGVAGFSGTTRVRSVLLSDGSEVTADVVVVGIGTTGPTIAVDACGRTAEPDVYACGDVASWWRPSAGRHVRVEHWTSAAGQARAVASALSGVDKPYDDTPYFWSDQFGLRLQHVGHAETWDHVELDGGEAAFTARYTNLDGRVVSALAANRSTELAGLRRELAA